MTFANALTRPPDDQLVWVCLVPFGTWKGHPSGEQTYGPDECETMAANWNRMYAAANKPMPLDYGHASLAKADAPASGWCWSVEIGEHPDENGNPVAGLWGRVQWTPRAADGIKAQEYSGAISPVIVRGSVDPVTGDPMGLELWNAALTNQPFMLDAMPQAMAANLRVFTRGNDSIVQKYINQNTGGPMANQDLQPIFDKIMSKLGIPAGTDPQVLLEVADQLSKLLKATEGMEDVLGTQEGAAPPPPEGAAPPEGDPAAQVGAMADAMPAMAAAARALTDITKLVNARDGRDALAKIAAMQNKGEGDVAELRAELASMKAETLMAKYAKKIPPAKRDFWRAKFAADPAGTEEIMSVIPDVLPGPAGDPAPAAAPKDGFGLTPEEKAAMDAKMSFSRKTLELLETK